MERKTRLNTRLEKIVQYYRKVSAYQRSEHEGIRNIDSLKPHIRIKPEDMVRCDRNGLEIIEEKNIDPSPLGLFNGVVPQQCSDSRPDNKISSDEHNDCQDWRNSGSYNLNNKSGRTMEEESNDVDLMTISDDSLTLVNERKDIEIIDLSQDALTMDENKDMNEADYRPHDESHFYFNKVEALLHQLPGFLRLIFLVINLGPQYL